MHACMCTHMHTHICTHAHAHVHAHTHAPCSQKPFARTPMPFARGWPPPPRGLCASQLPPSPSKVRPGEVLPSAPALRWPCMLPAPFTLSCFCVVHSGRAGQADQCIHGVLSVHSRPCRPTNRPYGVHGLRASPATGVLCLQQRMLRCTCCHACRRQSRQSWAARGPSGLGSCAGGGVDRRGRGCRWRGRPCRWAAQRRQWRWEGQAGRQQGGRRRAAGQGRSCGRAARGRGRQPAAA